jgi:hypothetical protein
MKSIVFSIIILGSLCFLAEELGETGCIAGNLDRGTLMVDKDEPIILAKVGSACIEGCQATRDSCRDGCTTANKDCQKACGHNEDCIYSCGKAYSKCVDMCLTEYRKCILKCPRYYDGPG